MNTTLRALIGSINKSRVDRGENKGRRKRKGERRERKIGLLSSNGKPFANVGKFFDFKRCNLIAKIRAFEWDCSLNKSRYELRLFGRFEILRILACFFSTIWETVFLFPFFFTSLCTDFIRYKSPRQLIA